MCTIAPVRCYTLGRYTAYLRVGEAVARKFCFFREAFLFLCARKRASLFKNFGSVMAFVVFKCACPCEVK